MKIAVISWIEEHQPANVIFTFPDHIKNEEIYSFMLNELKNGYWEIDIAQLDKSWNLWLEALKGDLWWSDIIKGIVDIINDMTDLDLRVSSICVSGHKPTCY